MLDLTMQAIQASLDGLAARQRIIRAEPRELRDAGLHRPDRQLRGQPRARDRRAATRARRRSRPASPTDPTNINGNNVTVDTETISLIDTGLRYQLATQSMNNKFRILHDSMRQDL